HPRAELAELLWPEVKNGRGNLRWVVGEAKKILPEALESTRNTLAFIAPSDYLVDTLAINAALKAGDMDRLSELLLETQGEFLAGYFDDESAEFEIWLLTQRESWRRKLLTIIEDLIHYHNGRSDYALATRFANKWLEIEPWEEVAHRWIMELLTRQGQLEAALEQYERCSRVLAEELGTEPEDETTELFKRLQQTSAQPTHNLPSLPAFVGRSAELARLSQLFHDESARIITIVGAGGMGKTHLATHAAAQSLNLFLDGIALVRLAPLESADNIAETVISTLADIGIIPSFMGGQSPVRFLAQELRNKEVLIVLDNVEHMIDSTLSLLKLVDRLPKVTLLITSRERLNVRWEQIVDLSGLPHTEAHTLFVRAAQRHWPPFSVGNNTHHHIHQICALVEGMPLGIELAASWVRMQSCQKIAEAIASNLDFLTTRDRDRPDRHRSIRAAFNYSWELLSPEEQTMLGKLAVFQGGFSAEAAQEVADATWADLAPFIDKSLIHQQLAVERDGANVRYQLHGLLRHFSLKKKEGQLDPVRKQHAAYYAKMLYSHERALRLGLAEALDEVERELPNVQQAWEWSIQTNTVENLTMGMQSLAFFTDARCRWQTALNLFRPATERLLTLDETPNVMLARGGMLAALGSTYGRLTKYTIAQGLLEEALIIFKALTFDFGIMFCLFAIGRVLENSTKLDEAHNYYNQSRIHAEKTGDDSGIARASVNLAVLLLKLGDYSTALGMAEQSLPSFEVRNERRELVTGLASQARCLYALGQLKRALSAARSCEAVATEIKSALSIGEAKKLRGEILFALGRCDEAVVQLEAAIQHLTDVGDIRAIISAWSQLALVLLRCDRPTEAIEMAQRALSLSQREVFSEGELDARCVLAMHHLDGGQLLKAQTELIRALQLSAELKRPPLQLRVLSLLGELGVHASQNTDPLYNLLSSHPATEYLVRQRVRDKAKSSDTITLEKAMSSFLPNYT
ncbi:MAG: ATP-binding protein, partial [Candidatus Promineifilaceae bacterium]